MARERRKLTAEVILECGHERGVFNAKAKIKNQHKVLCWDCQDAKMVVAIKGEKEDA